MPRRVTLGLAALLASGTLVCGACAPTPTTPSPTAPPTVSKPSLPAQPASPSPVSSPTPGAQTNPAVDAALRDASSHLGVPVTDLTVVSVEAHDWSDASLGCPRQGVLYAQVITPGYLIVISGGGKTLEYHTDASGRVVLCQES
jgi:hypothetical protein